ncbi:glycoside hydrolase superfamily [Fomitopsis serialis]|uniref:glycoside hydrolase superfamily n=1 Tax=Fomitopsis serialis TaxID=139415 RepID=UPI002007EF34|nr:glycoside hydrolase superfamily [Neoantrodia serialis]KAH9934661.1 glycoside hydrolase superfamily [Neoantrodia serialis]
MVLSSQYFSALLQALSLTQGLYKPTPSSSGADLASVPGTSSVGQGDGVGDVRSAQPVLQSDDTQGVYSDPCTPPYYPALAVENQTFPPFDQAKANVYRYRQQQSVNLGSWFVHEAWMTPSVFACASGQQLSELDIATGWNSTDNARMVLEHHWDTFINQSDFEYLASIGINTVRLPIGYWSLGPQFSLGTPFENVSDVYQNSWPRVTRAISMAGQAGMGVLVDLHGAPGSQNGQPHSGVSDGVTGLFNSQANMNLTISILTFLAEQLVNVTNVVGIEILNEPQDDPELPNFCNMRATSIQAASFPLYIHDAFDLDQFSSYVANRTDFVVVDHHSYFVFTPSDDAEPATQHTTDVETSIAGSFAAAAGEARRNLVIDEWSCALTPESLSSVSDPDQSRKDFCQGQMNVYANTTAGWGFWAYNKEDCSDDPGWCFKAAVGNSLPATFFSYGQGPLTDPNQLPSLADLMGDMSAPPASVVLASAQSSPTNASSMAMNDVQSTSTPSITERRWHSRGRTRDPTSWRRHSSWSNRRAHKRDYDAGMSPEQRAIAKGYSDGFFTAKIFAQYGMSKLGFTGQYMNDSIAKLGPGIIKPGTEGNYQEWFMKGLQDGENIVISHVGQTNLTST